ncbi:MAG TPA: hypothetical protein VKU00_24440, partial [Chthonomonadaceae bacterium]|nr:hypothetical protein [Chthonomonadaceae bacterium]
MRIQRPALFLTTLALTGALAGAIALTHRTARADGNTAAYTPKPKGTLTYTKDIAPILYANCSGCHRPDEVAPFALLSYQDAKKRADQLAAVTQSHYMPPWHAESHGEFLDEHKLTADQIGVLKQWADEGAAEGAASDLPPTPKFAQGWTLGKPDLVLTMPKSYTMRAEGGDIYRCFVLPTGLTEDRYVAAAEVRPGNAKVVHHVISYLDNSGKARQLEAANKDGQGGYSSYGGIGTMPSGTLGGWAPGNMPRLLPDGVGMLLPKGADIVLQVHYHSSGKAETD